MAFDPLSPVVPRDLLVHPMRMGGGHHAIATGSTLLANDPHLLTAPSIWYLARLELNLAVVIGGTIPGVPVVMVGRSADLGWASSSSNLDDQGLYRRVNPSDANQYRVPNGWANFESAEHCAHQG
jgi:penicillin amidase